MNGQVQGDVVIAKTGQEKIPSTSRWIFRSTCRVLCTAKCKYFEEMRIRLHAIYVNSCAPEGNRGEQNRPGTEVCFEFEHLIQFAAGERCHVGTSLCFPSLWQMWKACYFGAQYNWDNLRKLIGFMNIYGLVNEKDWSYLHFQSLLNCMWIPALYFNKDFCKPPAWFRQWYCPAVGFSAYQAFVPLHPDEWLLPQFFNWKWNNAHVDGDKKQVSFTLHISSPYQRTPWAHSSKMFSRSFTGLQDRLDAF